MIKLTNGIDDCKFSWYNQSLLYLDDTAPKKDCIRINGMWIKDVDMDGFENMEMDEKINLLQDVFSKFCRYNYPPFWRNPFKYIFGSNKCYDWSKIRYS